MPKLISFIIIFSCIITTEADTSKLKQNGPGWEVSTNNPSGTKWEIMKYKKSKCLQVKISDRFTEIELTKTYSMPSEKDVCYFSFYQKSDNPMMKSSVNPQIFYIDAKGKVIHRPKSKATWRDGKRIRNVWEHAKAFYMYSCREKMFGKWLKRVYILPQAANAKKVKIVIKISGIPGTVYLRKFKVYSKPLEKQHGDFLNYAPFSNLGYAPQLAFLKLQKEHSVFLEGAEKYNKAMMKLADVQENQSRLQRTLFYTGQETKAAEYSTEPLMRDFKKLYSLYGNFFREKNKKSFKKEFIPAVKKLENKLDKFTLRVKKESENLALDNTDYHKIKPVKIPPNGRLKSILFGKHSAYYHDEMEKMIGDFNQIRWEHRLSGIRVENNGNSLNCNGLLKRLKNSKAKINLIPYPLKNHDIMVMPSFVDNNWKNPEIYLQGAKDKNPTRKPNWNGGNFNYLNPEVVASSLEATREITKALKGVKKIYVVNWEDHGPIASRHGGNYSVGYGKIAQKEFQKYLKDKYKNIANLNQKHKAKYKSFADIRLPEDDLRESWREVPANKLPKRINPMRYEFLSWLHAAWQKYCIKIYREIKKNDPDAILLSDYNYILILNGFDPMMLTESCDMLNNHGDDMRQVLPQSAMLASLKKYHGKQLATFEDHWGRQDAKKSPGDENAQKASIIKHIGRLANRGYFLQNWWYSYLRSSFIVSYGSANWADPAFDLTTFRYCSTGLRTGIERARRFEKYFINTEKIRSKIVIIIPETSMYHTLNGKSYNEIVTLYKLLYGENYRFEFLTEKLILSGKADLSEYKICLIPYAPYFPAGLWGKFIPWIKTGGTLIGNGPYGIYDQFGYDNSKSLTASMIQKAFPETHLLTFPVGQKYKWNWDNREIIKSKTVGKGKIVLASMKFDNLVLSAELRKDFLALFKDIKRYTYSPDTRAELTFRKDKQGNSYIFSLNPSSDTVISGTIYALGKYKNIVDLGLNVDWKIKSVKYESNYTRFKFRLAPGGYTFFKLH